MMEKLSFVYSKDINIPKEKLISTYKDNIPDQKYTYS